MWQISEAAHSLLPINFIMTFVTALWYTPSSFDVGTTSFVMSVYESEFFSDLDAYAATYLNTSPLLVHGLMLAVASHPRARTEL